MKNWRDVATRTSYEEVRVMKKTTCDWYPPYRLDGPYRGKPLDLVEVSFLELSDNSWRVCIWGADDTGKEKDFLPEQREDAWQTFVLVISQDAVNPGWLADNGFINA